MSVRCAINGIPWKWLGKSCFGGRDEGDREGEVQLLMRNGVGKQNGNGKEEKKSYDEG